MRPVLDAAPAMAYNDPYHLRSHPAEIPPHDRCWVAIERPPDALPLAGVHRAPLRNNVLEQDRHR